MGGGGCRYHHEVDCFLYILECFGNDLNAKFINKW